MTGWPRLVALDIDGTLLSPDEVVAPRVRSAVRAAVDAGAHVVLATGRSAYGVEPVLDLLGLDSGCCVASNGAVIFRYRPVEVTRTVTFDATAAVEAVLARVPNALVAVEVVGDGYRVNRHFPDGEITGRMWVEPVSSLVREPVTRVIIRDPASTAEDFVRLAASLGLHGTGYFVGYTAWLDLAPDGVSKASALQTIADELDVRPADVLAIGDGRNDLEMLAWAGRGVAMGQAYDEVVSAADDVTAALADDGVAVELSRWFPLIDGAAPAAAGAPIDAGSKR